MRLDFDLPLYDLLAMGEPTGFPNRTDTTLSWSDANLRLTVAGTNWVLFVGGRKYVKNTETVDITNTVGQWFFYYSVTGVLTTSQVFPDIKTQPLVAAVYWNGTNGLLQDERHGIQMDGSTHEYLHDTVGVRYGTGLTGTFTNPAAISVLAGTCFDEDIENTVGSTLTQCRVFYHSAGKFTFTAAQNGYYTTTGGVLAYDPAAGGITAVDDNKYIAMWVFFSNDVSTPLYVIMGQNQSVNLATARSVNTYETLVFGSLPSAEMKLLYRVILQRSGASVVYVETADYRSVSNIPSGTFIATNHDVLTNLATQSHPAYTTIDGTRAFTGAQSMGTQRLTNLAAPTTAGDAIRQTTNITEVNLEDITDGGLTTIHKHSSLAASDGSPDPALSMDAAGIGTFVSNVSMGNAPVFTHRLQTHVSNAISYGSINCWSTGTTTHYPALVLIKSHNATIGTASETQASEILGSISALGVNSSSAYETAAEMRIVQLGASGATYVGGRFEFYTATNAATRGIALTIKSDKDIAPAANVLMTSTMYVGLGADKGRLILTDGTVDSLGVSDGVICYNTKQSVTCSSAANVDVTPTCCRIEVTNSINPDDTAEITLLSGSCPEGTVIFVCLVVVNGAGSNLLINSSGQQQEVGSALGGYAYIKSSIGWIPLHHVLAA